MRGDQVQGRSLIWRQWREGSHEGAGSQKDRAKGQGLSLNVISHRQVHKFLLLSFFLEESSCWSWWEEAPQCCGNVSIPKWFSTDGF